MKTARFSIALGLLLLTGSAFANEVTLVDMQPKLIRKVIQTLKRDGLTVQSMNDVRITNFKGPYSSSHRYRGPSWNQKFGSARFLVRASNGLVFEGTMDLKAHQLPLAGPMFGTQIKNVQYNKVP